MRPDLDEAGIRSYLLGLLPEAEAEALEEAYFARPEVWERVRGVEDDLLDDYAAGRLGPGEKQAFESRYLASPPLRERVVAARVLATASDTEVPAARVATARPMRWGGPLAIAASLLVAVVAFWAWPPPAPPPVTSIWPPPTSAATSEAPPSPPAEPMGSSAAPAPTPPRPSPGVRPLVLALSPVLLRGQARPVELRIPPGADTVVLELEGDPAIIPRSASALDAAVQTVEGERVWRGEARRVRDAGRPSLLASARVPAAKLGPGDYLVTLSARGSAGGALHSYFFRVGR